VRLLIEGNVCLWNQRRGIPRVYREILPRLPQHVAEADIRIAVQGKRPGSAALADGCRFVRIPNLRPGLRPWRFWGLVAPPVDRLLAASFWRSATADVFHSTSYEMSAVSGPSLALVHDMMPELFPDLFPGRAWRQLAARKKRTVERAALVLCVSDNTKRDVIKLLGVSEEKCRVSHNGGFLENGLDAAGTAPRGVGERPFLLYVGGHRVPYKNFALLVRFLGSGAGQAFRDLDLVMAGPEAPADGELAEYGKRIDPNRLRFLNDCTDAHLTFLYQRCSAFVMPSLYEGFGIPVVEALSCGAPVVCSDRASLPEAGGDAVQYFDPGAPQTLRVALQEALSEGRSSAAIGKRRAQAGRFTWDDSARRFGQAVRDVCR